MGLCPLGEAGREDVKGGGEVGYSVGKHGGKSEAGWVDLEHREKGGVCLVSARLMMADKVLG